MSDTKDEKENVAGHAMRTESTRDADKAPIVESRDDAVVETEGPTAADRRAPTSVTSDDGTGEPGLELPSPEAMGLVHAQPASAENQEPGHTPVWDLDAEPELPPVSAFQPSVSERDRFEIGRKLADDEPDAESRSTERSPQITDVGAAKSLPNGDEAATHTETPISASRPATVATDDRSTATEGKLDELVAQLDGEMASSYGSLLGPDVESAAREAESDVAKKRYLLFTLDETFWAVPIGAIVEVESVPAITRVPNVPDWILGVASMRGDIVSVVDAKALLGLDPTIAPERGRIVIGKSTREGMIAGLVVDDVNGFIRVAEDDVSTPSARGDNVVTPFLLGVCEHKDALVSILDLGRFLDSRSVRQFEPV